MSATARFETEEIHVEQRSVDILAVRVPSIIGPGAFENTMCLLLSATDVRNAGHELSTTGLRFTSEQIERAVRAAGDADAAVYRFLRAVLDRTRGIAFTPDEYLFYK